MMNRRFSKPSNTNRCVERFLLDHSTLKTRSEATESQVRNVKTWLKNSNGAIVDTETGFIEKTGDLIPVVSKNKTPMRRFFDRFDATKKIPCFTNRKVSLNTANFSKCLRFRANCYKLNRLLDKEKGFEDFESQTTIYNKESRIDKFVTCATIVVGLAMLIGPLWLLQSISGKGQNARLVIISSFLIAFTLLVSVVTVAKPFEVLAATAAYGAVLMVFMQLGTPSGN